MDMLRTHTLEALMDVLERGKKPKDAVDARAQDLDTRNRGFMMELLYGVVRRRDLLDHILLSFLDNPGGLPPRTLSNLRAAVYQILYMDVPDWATVDEAVNIELKQPKLVNAVLRNIIRNRSGVELDIKSLTDEASDQTVPQKKRTRAMATLTSHPLWLVKRWVSRLGPAEALALLNANNEIPPLTLRVNTLASSRSEVIGMLQELSIPSEATRLSPVGIKVLGTVPVSELMSIFKYATIQDEAAQLVSIILDPQPGERVLDICAAPGGKTTHMAQMMQDRGEVVALDIEERRLLTLNQNVRELGLKSITQVCADALEYTPDKPFDRILVDAPCSALGVLRRNPDAKYRHSVKEIKRLSEIQGRIFDKAASLLKPGGRIVYATCSTEPEEGEDVISSFLKRSGDSYIIERVSSDVIQEDSFMRTWPHRHGTDGFFCAALGKKL
ncbi:16S rRNA (cytosine(967)-C(5))-methyltransferase RsmB [Nitrospirota bacterium]